MTITLGSSEITLPIFPATFPRKFCRPVRRHAMAFKSMNIDEFIDNAGIIVLFSRNADSREYGGELHAVTL